MTKKLREKLDEDLRKLDDIVKGATLHDLRDQARIALNILKRNAKDNLDALERANGSADYLIDPWIQKIVRSKWTLPILLAIFASGVVVGVVARQYLSL